MATDDERRKQHRHRHKQRVLRGIDDTLVADFDSATRRAGSDRSGITRQLWEWYVGRPGVKLPERPDPENRS
jgi:predicted Ser/Thr protein kinase